MTPTTALIDADMLCFTFCASAEKEIEWEKDFWTLDTDLVEAKRKVEDWVSLFSQHYSSLIFCWSDSENFRKELEPTYKTNRTTRDFRRNGKPIGYSALRAWITETYTESVAFKGLEGDDVMGVLMAGESTVCLSGDKDLRTVPGFHAPLFEYQEPEWVTNAEADRFWLIQTLTGDTTDGYKGCPGYGFKTANDFLEASRPYVRNSKDTGWKKAKEPSDPWTCVVSAYAKAGLSEDYALTQARLARILRPREYDFPNETPILWSSTEPIAVS